MEVKKDFIYTVTSPHHFITEIILAKFSVALQNLPIFKAFYKDISKISNETISNYIGLSISKLCSLLVYFIKALK